jgi:peroxiredoxin
MSTDTTTLKDRIGSFTTGLADRVPPQVVAGLGAELTKLAEAGIAKNALAVGAKAPDFTLPDSNGKPVMLSALLSKGPVVVTFYRGGWCPFCDLQLRAYQEALPEIRRFGGELVAISPQTPDYALSDVEKKALTFPVLTDAHNEIGRKFGLVFKLSEAFQALHAGFGSVLPKFNGDDSWELPMPGTFVIDRTGTIRLAHVDPNYMVRLEPSAIVTALRALAS